MTRLSIGWKLLFCAMTWAVLCASASAQYKYIGPDGRVTYSDQPPPAGTRVLEEKRVGKGAVTSSVVLPFAIQQAMSKFPVTIITGDKCSPCDDGRAYLKNRGVPYTEKTVTSDEDIAAFKSQSADGTAPVLVVGSRKSIGFAQSSWASLLDDAGYPATSVLPAEYQNAAAQPLSPQTKPASQAVTPAAQAPQRTAAGTTPPRRGASAPGGNSLPPVPATNTPAAPSDFKF